MRQTSSLTSTRHSALRLLVVLALALVMPLIYLRSASAVPQGAPDGLAAADWIAIQTLLSPIQQAYLKASNTRPGHVFSFSLAVSGDTVVVGARNESSSATGVNGNQTDTSALAAGAVYVFVRSGTTWMQQAYLKASNPEAFDYFGFSVAVSGDTVVVGAPNESSNATGVNGDQTDNSTIRAGAAYIFVRSGATWAQQAYLKASNTEAGDGFGSSVAVSGDTVVVGARNHDLGSGAAYVFARSGAAWTQQAYLKASVPKASDYFGSSVAVSGDTVAVGAYNESRIFPRAGAAYVFARSGTTWTQQAYLKASNRGALDYFGSSVAVSGDTVVVGAYGESSNATGVNGNQTDDSVTRAGAVYVFAQSGTSWTQQAYLKASNTGEDDYFGSSVAVSGDVVVVGAFGENSSATGVNGNQADNNTPRAGATYVFVRSGTTWTQQAYLKASNTQADDSFGSSVAVSGDTVAVGAGGESSSATGVNGNQADNSAMSAGAVYMFALNGSTPIPHIYLPIIRS